MRVEVPPLAVLNSPPVKLKFAVFSNVVLPAFVNVPPATSNVPPDTVAVDPLLKDVTAVALVPNFPPEIVAVPFSSRVKVPLLLKTASVFVCLNDLTETVPLLLLNSPSEFNSLAKILSPLRRDNFAPWATDTLIRALLKPNTEFAVSEPRLREPVFSEIPPA